MRQLVKVTEDHIARGVQKSASRCPVALALMDCGYDLATVTEMDMTASPMEGVWLWGETPQEAKAFIAQFDADTRAVEAFSFHCMLRKTEGLT